ncbi:putative N-acetyltransferase YhbS [Rhizobium sp. BK529]|uniref:GNAT family N-acetyltransferase n=1 Tax=unclassified Rhizobium TaxID=2613769 RepID=UPI00104DB1AF|nr:MULTISPECIES: GNAT family N-acetyltransferase [unclassified Rhizobium]MBB3592815.1 putative N-acetyltransferase YhbS [Rhizobium sp. BK529]TCS07197.1 acetyltransferase (GNAT) family protein [Rhizobium sp. BK418]
MSAFDTTGLTFRQDYFNDPTAWAALVSLLDDTFGIDIDPLRELGGADPTSMPFGWFTEEGVLAANLSAFAMPFVFNGRLINAAALQSGAVRPPWRGRGLYRDVTRKALAWCEAQSFGVVILYTDKPGLYEPYGFRSLPLHKYIGAAPVPVGSATSRPLQPRDANDLALLQDLLASRTPVSQTLAVASSPAMFLINTQFDPNIRLSYLEESKAAIAWKMAASGHFILLDVVAPEIPSLAAILAGLRVEARSVETLFRPDRLGWSGEAVPYGGETRLMLRGMEEVRLDHPAMLSPMADF